MKINKINKKRKEEENVMKMEDKIMKKREKKVWENL